MGIFNFGGNYNIILEGITVFSEGITVFQPARSFLHRRAQRATRGYQGVTTKTTEMTFNGVIGSCPEDASYSSFVPNQAPLSLTLEDGSFEMVSTRPGCRGNSMADSG
jgi:hypothetical protein